MLDSQTWLRQQGSVIHDIFDAAATELQEAGIRVLIGSAPAQFDEFDSTMRIMLSPLRLASAIDGESLSLGFLATTKGGGAHYAVELEMSGVHTCAALRKLASEHADVWERGYLRTGLWVSDGAEWEQLNRISQINEARTSKLAVSGTFLHSATTRTIQDGVIVVGLLYRSTLDELCDAGKLGRQFAQLSHSLGNRRPTFQRIVRPRRRGVI